MLYKNDNLFPILEQHADLKKRLFEGNFGLEKENVRVDKNGNLSLTPHPEIFGLKEENPYIKTDFSESQIEIITPVSNSVDDVYTAMENLQNIVSDRIRDEYLWPNSNPPILPAEQDIPIAVYQNPQSASRLYREHLAREYGKKIQLFSGIHYNFSFSDAFLTDLHEKLGGEKTLQDFKNQIYLKVAKYFMQNRWFLLYLTGASPIYLPDFLSKPATNEVSRETSDLMLKNGVSLRNSHAGYKNKCSLHVDYCSFDNYIASIQSWIDNGKIDSMRELYNPIRLKNSHTDQSLAGLAEAGVEYIEIRSLDLNPFDPNGITKETMHFIQLLLVTGLLTESEAFDKSHQEQSDENEERIASDGLSQPDIFVNGSEIPFEKAVDKLLTEMEQVAKQVGSAEFLDLLAKQREISRNPEKTVAAQLVATTESFVPFHLEKARIYLNESLQNAYKLIGYEDMELSTQIVLKSAVTKGFAIELLDREENFIRLEKGNQVEYIKQATKTARDSYISALIMENKVVTKQVLAEHGIEVPHGRNFSDLKTAQANFEMFADKPIVVKPKSTNFGIGISIFKDGFTQKDYEEALKIAFSYDSSVIIETYIPGDEYRFLVIDGKIAGILKRIPANVTGDGIHTVSELIDEKNLDPLRGTDHLKPLEEILKGPEETLMLSMQGFTMSDVPPSGQIVYLRENSNISTGGDSIDVTDLIHPYYQELAIECAKVVDANLCGVDIIVSRETMANGPYAVIELNFNPAINIHAFPYQGENRRIGDMILDFLFKK
ncbi:bifunctional glutamate--cysteine ligase GshA/glutathione synthetase GshB [Listeria grandensis]|uniref:bifunctional glutamate--cysteine ligase GshA/glutathione synthetase GshB n=1 Tax=Listeria grandensis TaxID=1494963 RepID=UPI00164E39E2|nr:bifunctional glutamate--cysteine ligase GshA/glutathione synthetase GshB [Listeria grandensis]